jgi:adenylate cyclase
LKCEEALSIDPSCAAAYGQKGTALMFSGRREAGRIALQNCLRLNPCDPGRAIRFLEIAISYYFNGSYEQAADLPASNTAIPQPCSQL